MRLFSALAALILALPLPARADHPAVGFGSGVSGPIVTIPASVLPMAKWGASFRVEWVTFKTFSDSELVTLAQNGTEAHSTHDVVSPSLSLAYGVSRTFTASARLPYIVRHDIREGHLEGVTAEVHDHGDSRGIGDVTVLGEFLVWEREPSKIALLTGIKTPTGRTKVTSGGERLETEHQPGSGSWDLLEGIAWSGKAPIGYVDANLLATFPSQGSQETNLGTLLTYNVALSRKLAEGHHHHPGAMGADLIVELNGEVRAHEKVAGAEDPNSGGNLLYLAPGFRFGPQAWSASFSFGAPIVQSLNGTQHEAQFRLLFGLSASF